jgi:CheY-like chemotaxis protein
MKASRILIVEDERLVAEDLRDTLTQVGYSVAGIVASGERAVDKVAESGPDLVLMDINLSGEMDGISAAEEIRSRHGTPVVYLTAFSNDRTLARARETDAFGFIVKPFQEKAVIAAIEMALGKHGKERVHRRREELLHSGLMTLPLGVLMTDHNDRLVFANSLARLHIGRSLDTPEGVLVADVFLRETSAEPEAEPAPGAPPQDRRGSVIEMTGRRLGVAYSEEKLRGESGQELGRIIMYQDIEHPAFTGELGRLLQSLMQTSRSSPHNLTQFLTICAWSKRVKVDDATWVSFEDFLTHYLGLHVTHGMAPEVAQKWVASGFKDPVASKGGSV